MIISSNCPNIQNSFFYITSENLDTVFPSIYGYYISDENNVISNKPVNRMLPEMTAGQFVNIVVSDMNIIIQQDYFAGFGIFYFKADDFWASSNSFFLLLSKLRSRFKLTLNDGYIATYIIQQDVPYSIYYTALNEIHELIPGHYININKSNKSFCQEKMSDKSFSLKINNQYALDLIDRWKNKWQSIALSIVDTVSQLNIEITGGKDSRAVLSTLVGLDLRNPAFNFYTLKWGNPEDRKIGEEIAGIFGFRLTNQFKGIAYSISALDKMKIYDLSKFMVHAAVNLPNVYCRERNFTFTGYGGEALRDYVPYSFSVLESRVFSQVNMVGEVICRKCLIFLRKCLDFIKERYNSDLEDEQTLYNYCRQKNHFGRFSLAYMLANRIMLSPLMDPMLYLLNISLGASSNRQLLFALIYDRFLPQLNKVKFSNNSILYTQSVLCAHLLNTLYPRSKYNFSKYSLFFDSHSPYKPINYLPFSLNKIIFDSLNSELFRSLLLPTYSDLYKKGLHQLRSQNLNLIGLGFKMFNIGKLFYLISSP